MNRYICIHGHFYQPPRENPWLEAIELQDSAYPYHDWNQRITAECYAPNTAARILDHDRKIVQIVNNYAKMSFNFGPTLLSWMERHDPETYHAILDADQISQKIFGGHGSALMQCFNHMIMPLANSRDKRTQVLWGLRDFEHRFRRKPEGAWIPETAVDLETLDLLAEQGIRFTVLAPHQAKCVRRIGEGNWRDVHGGIDPKRPYLCHLPSGKTIQLFFYDGPISRDVAFTGLLLRGEDFANRMQGAFVSGTEPQLVHIATDGETYGHHHHMADMALAYCLNAIERHHQAQITNYSQYLEMHPAQDEVQIFENSSWSCIHGIERWRRHCGCCSGGNMGWTQGWRFPLREAMNWLRDELGKIFEIHGAQFLEDAWAARDDYISVALERSEEQVSQFMTRNAQRRLTQDEIVQCLKLLEMQRHAMLMFTSCGWFFDEISGIETVQIMEYAARAIQLAEEINGFSLQGRYLEFLAQCPSNLAQYRNGAVVFEKLVRPKMLDLKRVGAHYAVSSLFEEYSENSKIYCYTMESQLYDRLELGKQKLAIGRARIRSEVTFQESVIHFSVLHEGEQSLICGVKECQDDKIFSRMQHDIKEAFRRNDIRRTKQLIENEFGEDQYSFAHLFPDEQRKILYQILDATLEEVEQSLRQINEHHHPIIHVIRRLKIPLPRVLAHTVLLILQTDLIRVLRQEEVDIAQLHELVQEAHEWAGELDKVTLGFIVARRTEDLMIRLFRDPEDCEVLESVTQMLEVLQPLSLQLDLWRAQNFYFAIGRTIYKVMRLQAKKGQEKSQRWVELFERLGVYFQAKIT